MMGALVGRHPLARRPLVRGRPDGQVAGPRLAAEQLPAALGAADTLKVLVAQGGDHQLLHEDARCPPPPRGQLVLADVDAEPLGAEAQGEVGAEGAAQRAPPRARAAPLDRRPLVAVRRARGGSDLDRHGAAELHGHLIGLARPELGDCVAERALQVRAREAPLAGEPDDVLALLEVARPGAEEQQGLLGQRQPGLELLQPAQLARGERAELLAVAGGRAGEAPRGAGVLETAGPRRGGPLL